LYFKPQTATDKPEHGMVLGPPWVSGKGYSGFEKIEDVYLIAAAPDLKDAITSFISCQCYNRATEGSGICGACWKRMNSAIAKAEGKGE
jgi:hypothetical protein